MQTAITLEASQNSSGGNSKTKYTIRTNNEYYFMESENILRIYHYCLKKYRYQDFKIESN